MQTKLRDTPYCQCRPKKIAMAAPVYDPAVLQHLYCFITERYKIHVRKDVQGKPFPWTKNTSLQQYKFTNVFRENDRVSRSLITHISQNKSLILEEKVLNTFLFRSWNNPNTFFDLGGPWPAFQIYNGLALKEAVRPTYQQLAAIDPGRKWWSSAYNQGGTKYAWKFPDGEGFSRAPSEEEGQKYQDYEPDIPLRVFHLGPWLKQQNTFVRLFQAKDQAEAFDIIRELRGFASFLAYQVFVDLTYIKEFPFSENEFTVAGPGCKRGLNALFKDYDGLTHEEALFWLRDNIDELFQSLYDDGCIAYPWEPQKLFINRDPQDRCLNVMSLENCFCELSKYLKVVQGIGRPRCTYKPNTDKGR